MYRESNFQYLTILVEISIRGKGVVADTIQQQVRVITEENKMKVLLECIADWYDKGSILVFVDTQESTDTLWYGLFFLFLFTLLVTTLTFFSFIVPNSHFFLHILSF